MTEHLVERGHASGGGVTAAVGQAGGAEVSGIVTLLRRIGVGAAGLLGLGHPHENVVAEAQRLDHPFADDIPEILAGDGLEHHRLHEMGGAGVVLQAAAGRPFQREIADLGAHQRVVGPGGLGHVGIRKAALVGHDLLQRDLGFAAGGELRQEVGDFVHEGQLAFLDQRPNGGGGQHLGLAEQQEQGFVGGGDRSALGLGVAVGAEQPSLPLRARAIWAPA